MSPPAGRPVIGVWGTSDADRFGDALYPRVLERELTRRLPDARVRTYAPFGPLHPTRFDGGRAAEPLGVWSPGRAAELAAQLDCVIVCGGDLGQPDDLRLAAAHAADPDEIRAMRPSGFMIEALGTEPDPPCPVAWFGVGVPADLSEEESARLRAALARRALVAVCGERSLERLLLAGVTAEVTCHPSPLLLVPRLVEPDVLRRRLDQLRATDAYPGDGRPLVVAVGPASSSRAAEVARAAGAAAAERPGTEVVVVATGGDGSAATAVLAHLPRGAAALPEGAGTDDVVAAIAAASAVVSDAPAAALVARAYGVPAVELEETPAAELPGAIGRALDAAERATPDLAADLERLDAGLDRLAELAARSAVAREARRASDAGPPDAEGTDPGAARRMLSLLSAAHEERTQRLTAELTRERERAATQEDELAQRQTMIAHVQAAYEATVEQTATLTAALQAVQARVRDAEIALGAVQLNSARAMESLQVQTNATIGALQEQNAHLLAERGDLTARLDAVQAENAQLDAVLQSMLTSRSWRALAPARVTAQAIRRLAR